MARKEATESLDYFEAGYMFDEAQDVTVMMSVMMSFIVLLVLCDYKEVTCAAI